MPNWKFFLQDHALKATSVAGTNATSAANVISGTDNMLSQATSTASSWAFTLPSSVVCASVGLANHNIPANSTLDFFYESGVNWVQIGANQAISPYIDQVFSFTPPAANTRYKVTINHPTGFKIGCISLLSGSTFLAIESTDSWPGYPVDRELDAGIVASHSAGGARLEQKYGGASQLLTMRFRNLLFAKTDAGEEGLIDDVFLRQYMSDGTPTNLTGLPGPFWIVDDNGSAYHGHILRPLRFPIIGPGPRSDVMISFETLPHTGLV